MKLRKQLTFGRHYIRELTSYLTEDVDDFAVLSVVACELDKL